MDICLKPVYSQRSTQRPSCYYRKSARSRAYDSCDETSQEVFSNHINRQEVQEALKDGKGYDLRRTSETTGIPYFYSATLYPDISSARHCL